VIHSGYKCTENDLPCGVSAHGNYGFIGLNLCARSCLKGEQEQKTSDFLRCFISFERNLFAACF
jgi:hypothetical protein